MLGKLKMLLAEENVHSDRGDTALCQNIDKQRVVVAGQRPSAEGCDIVIIEIQNCHVRVGRDLSSQRIAEIQHAIFEPGHGSGENYGRENQRYKETAYRNGGCSYGEVHWRPIRDAFSLNSGERQSSLIKDCDPGANRTRNLQLRRLLLYPIELRGR